jgi:hypothetical protein
LNKLHYKLIVLLAVLSFFSCQNDIYKPEGPIITKEIQIESFNKLEVLDDFPVSITYGEELKVEVTGNDNIINLLNRNISNGLWQIKMTEGNYDDFELDILITIPNITRIISGSNSNISISDYTNATGLTLTTDANGVINMSNCINIGTLSSTINSNGDINMNGINTCTDAYITVNGNGEFKGFDLVSETCYAEVQGNSTIEITVNNTLNAVIVGNGTIYYKGTTSTITPDVTGNGEIIDAN